MWGSAQGVGGGVGVSTSGIAGCLAFVNVELRHIVLSRLPRVLLNIQSTSETFVDSKSVKFDDQISILQL